MAYVNDRYIYQVTALEPGDMARSQGEDYSVETTKDKVGGLLPGRFVQYDSTRSNGVVKAAASGKLVGVILSSQYDRDINFSTENGFVNGAFVKDAVIPLFFKGWIVVSIAGTSNSGVVVGGAVKISTATDTEGELLPSASTETGVITITQGVLIDKVVGQTAHLFLSGELFAR